MRKQLILDTCAIVWLVSGHDALSSEARSEIEAARSIGADYEGPVEPPRTQGEGKPFVGMGQNSGTANAPAAPKAN